MSHARPQRPSLEQHVEVETTAGTIHRWDARDLVPGNRPLNVAWGAARGTGFGDGSLNLSRDILRDWPDLGLVDTIRIIGGDGQVLYEGRNGNVGRESGDGGKQFGIQMAGWMSHARDRRFREVYIDRDASRWSGEIPIARRLSFIANTSKNRASGAVEQTTVSGSPAVRLAHSSLADSANFHSIAEAWYNAAGIPLGVLGFGGYGDRQAVDNTALLNTLWLAVAALSSDDARATVDATGNLAGTSAAGSVSSTGDRRFATLSLLFLSTFSGDSEWWAHFIAPYVMGTHGLSLNGGGLTASQMMRDCATRFCPKLDPSGIDDTSYPIKHNAPIDPIYPLDHWLELNAAHQWDLGVWEDKQLCFRSPKTLDDYDWQVRTDDPGVRITYGGSSLADLGNGVEVSFDDLETGTRKVITPLDYSDLADQDPNNPINRAGMQKWITYDVPFPTLTEDAVQYGRAALQEAIRAKAPATIDCGYWIQDRAGNWQPSAKVRPEQRIAIVDHPNNAPRRIEQIDYRQEGRGLRISADRASTRLSAINARIGLGRQAANL